MVKRTRLQEDVCPVARSLDVIGDWWSLLIVRDALSGVRRFSEFQRSLGVAKGMLAARLRDLVAEGVLETAPASDGSAYQEYVLTPKGRALYVVVAGLRQWGEEHCYGPGEAHSVLCDVAHGQPVARLELKCAEGTPLGPEDIVVVAPA
jgi:DNA-binding HxlR family transcriptional regulator